MINVEETKKLITVSYYTPEYGKTDIIIVKDKEEANKKNNVYYYDDEYLNDEYVDSVLRKLRIQKNKYSEMNGKPYTTQYNVYEDNDEIIEYR